MLITRDGQVKGLLCAAHRALECSSWPLETAFAAGNVMSSAGLQRMPFSQAHDCPALDRGVWTATAPSHQRLFVLGRHKSAFSPVLIALCKTPGCPLLPTSVQLMALENGTCSGECRLSLSLAALLGTEVSGWQRLLHTHTFLCCLLLRTFGAGDAHKSPYLPVLPAQCKTPGCPLLPSAMQFRVAGNGICARIATFQCSLVTALHWTGVSELRQLLHTRMPICIGEAHRSPFPPRQLQPAWGPLLHMHQPLSSC